MTSVGAKQQLLPIDLIASTLIAFNNLLEQYILDDASVKQKSRSVVRRVAVVVYIFVAIEKPRSFGISPLHQLPVATA